MRRTGVCRDTYGRVSGSSIPRPNAGNRRSSSADCVNRGSYLPSSRRTSSVERFRTSGSAVKHSRNSPRPSGANRISIPRGSLLDRKGALKDTRALGDRAYQRQCISSIIEYLEENNFPFSITPANMMPPTKKDFEKIFQFLYQMWDPKYEVTKLEEEAPKLLKTIGYPFMINKSSFLTINRMSWPALLGSIVWLTDLNKYSSSVSVSDCVFGEEFTNDEGPSIVLSYILESFQTGVDDAERDGVLFRQLINQKYDMDFSSDEMKRKIDDMNNLIERESKEQNEYLSLIETCKRLDEDIESYKKYLQEMEIHTKQKTSAVSDLQEQMASKEKTLQELKQAVSVKEVIYKAQGYEAEHAINFYNVTKSDLLQKLDESRKNLIEEEKICWDLKTELFQLKENVDGQCRKFNPSWEELRNTIKSGRTALMSIDLPSVTKIAKNFKITLPDFQLFPDCIDDVKCILEKIRAFTNEQRTNIHSVINSQKEKISELEMVVSDVAIKAEVALNEMSQKERDANLQNEENQRELESLKKKCEGADQTLRKTSDEHAKTAQSIENFKKVIEDQETDKEAILKELAKEKESAEAVKKEITDSAVQLVRKIDAEKKLVEQKLKSVLKIVRKDNL